MVGGGVPCCRAAVKGFLLGGGSAAERRRASVGFGGLRGVPHVGI
ncbi:hypothetical protein HMPREF9440_00781 [Sutterella parvirubra YIT 11816]|uniref:Uncharacterized protein n=1 Tax=Sutterella parvirubra YIT 11816 TaxID=762967 RepID=H3KDH2_9BURK|nr:hypothetical protein HMPREF9440_00781 [Sutterella parvirubra YIT 11816]